MSVSVSVSVLCAANVTTLCIMHDVACGGQEASKAANGNSLFTRLSLIKLTDGYLTFVQYTRLFYFILFIGQIG